MTFVIFWPKKEMTVSPDLMTILCRSIYCLSHRIGSCIWFSSSFPSFSLSLFFSSLEEEKAKGLLMGCLKASKAPCWPSIPLTMWFFFSKKIASWSGFLQPPKPVLILVTIDRFGLRGMKCIVLAEPGIVLVNRLTQLWPWQPVLYNVYDLGGIKVSFSSWKVMVLVVSSYSNDILNPAYKSWLGKELPKWNVFKS